jgi:hypothetical protein
MNHGMYELLLIFDLVASEACNRVLRCRDGTLEA